MTGNLINFSATIQVSPQPNITSTHPHITQSSPVVYEGPYRLLFFTIFFLPSEIVQNSLEFQ